MKKHPKSHIIAIFLAFALLFTCASCRGDLPEQTVPEQSVPEQTVPEQTVPEQSVPEQSVPEQTVPEQTVPEDNSSADGQPPTSSGEGEEEDNAVKATLIRTLVALNVRRGASLSSAVVGVTDVGDCLPYNGEVGDFYVTVYKGERAYISNNARYSALIYFDVAGAEAESVIEVGQTLIGFPYVYGAQRLHYGGERPVYNPSFEYGEFDCSSLVQYAYMLGAGVSLQVTTRMQFAQDAGERVSFENLRRGDLMYFTNRSRKDKTGIERIGHVAVYLGVGRAADGTDIGKYILHTATDHAVIEPLFAARIRLFEGGISVL